MNSVLRKRLLRPFVHLFLMLSGAALAQEMPTFRATTNLVNVTFSARNPQGTLVANLTRDDVEVFEDASPQAISFFLRSVDVPLTLGIIVDVSDSQRHFYKQHSRDLQVFLQEILGLKDKAFLICFGNHLRLASDFSQSGAELLEHLRRFDQGDRNFPEIGPQQERELGTAFYDAIYYSVTEKLAKENGRRALLIFSDGEDNSSSHDMMSTIDAAQSSNVPVFTLRYTQMARGRLTARNEYGISVMDRIARETGGRHFDARAINPHVYFKEIADELRTSYELAYYPSRPIKGQGFRKIVIRPRQDDLIIRCKTGYFPR